MKVDTFGVLFLIFLVLKLTAVIAWSWLWVTAPLWGPLVFILVLWATVMVIGAFTVGIGEAWKRVRHAVRVAAMRR